MIRIGDRAGPIVACLTLAALFPSPARAEGLGSVLAPERAVFLCKPGENGVSNVERASLAAELLAAARFPISLVLRDDSPYSQAAISKDRLFQPLTQDFTQADLPPQVPAEASKKIVADLDGIKNDFTSYLRGASQEFKGYKVVTNGADQESLLIEDYFAAGSRLEIACTAPAQAPTQSAEKKKGSFLGQLRLTGDVKHLSRTTTKLEDTTPATLSFKSDEEADTKTLNLNFIAGIEFEAFKTDLSRFNLLPYVHYQNKDIATKGVKDEQVESLAGGVLFNGLTRLGSSEVNIEYGVTPLFLADLQQNSEQFKISAFISPTFSIGSDDNPILAIGGYGPEIAALGGLTLRPDITFLLEGAYVFDSGEDEVLDDVDEYTGIGGEASLGLKFAQVAVLRNFTLLAKYRYLDLIGAELDDADRLSLALLYQFPEFLPMTIGFVYEDGENPTTFQDEEYWEATLGLRF